MRNTNQTLSQYENMEQFIALVDYQSLSDAQGGATDDRRFPQGVGTSALGNLFSTEIGRALDDLASLLIGHMGG